MGLWSYISSTQPYISHHFCHWGFQGQVYVKTNISHNFCPWKPWDWENMFHIKNSLRWSLDDFIILKKNHFHEYMILGLLVTTLKSKLLQIYRVILGVSYANLLFSEYSCIQYITVPQYKWCRGCFTSLVSQKKWNSSFICFWTGLKLVLNHVQYDFIFWQFTFSYGPEFCAEGELFQIQTHVTLMIVGSSWLVKSIFGLKWNWNIICWKSLAEF